MQTVSTVFIAPLRCCHKTLPVFLLSFTLTAEQRSKIDSAVREEVTRFGLPSASIAIVEDGRVAYVQAYGKAHLKPNVEAKPAMRYSIGSVSKQFTAAAILLLAQQGKLALGDPVSRFLPDLTRANEITIRQLLSHTSGYQDYYPQDYTPPFMLHPARANEICDRWARKPLDFEPGTEWQYSNTGYVIAGRIVERASGQPLFEFLRQHIFAPLNMTSVLNVDQEPLTESDATGYTRYGLGPWRIAPREANGWLYAAGGLAMTAEDLAKWDLSLINRSLLAPESYREMQSALVLKTGLASSYGLGVEVGRVSRRRQIAHDGAVSGFTAMNAVFPDDGVAVVVLTNAEGSGVGRIADKIVELLFREDDKPREEQRARQVLAALRRGKIDRALFSDNANFYFSREALADLARGLKPLGKLQSLNQLGRQERGGMTARYFVARFERKNLRIVQRTLSDGKIEQYLIMPQ